jgi:hypothetical protein
MHRLVSPILLFFIAINCNAQFAPPANQPGTSAMHKDSSAFTAWATGCSVLRGLKDVSNPTMGYATVGDSSMALGMADGSGIVSLGDGGEAVITFAQPIMNGSGWDFAIFENSFSNTFLELAFVEVSSDGLNFFRFPAVSNTQDTIQVNAFGNLDATHLNNLAGKYEAFYGTPFDLDELSGIPGLDIMHITHVKVKDVVGSIDELYATYDSNGHKINDPWTTPFPSSGFDLDAIGVINENLTGVVNYQAKNELLFMSPNPSTGHCRITFSLLKETTVSLTIFDMSGRKIMSLLNETMQPGLHQTDVQVKNLQNGMYILRLISSNEQTLKFFVQHD